MINAKELARQLDRFLKSPTCQDARVVVKLPQGEFHSPDGQFIQTPDACGLKLYEGLRIRELVACGLELEACSEGLDACRLKLESL
jgi:hypothetical protein